MISAIDVFGNEIYAFVQQHGAMVSVFKAITRLGDATTVVAFCSLVCAALIYRKDLLKAACCVGMLAAAWLINTAIKYAVSRERPDLMHFVVETSFSFPSAHAMISMAFLPFVAYLLFPEETRKKWMAVAACIAALIALSRVALGVHYLSDVVFGAIFGALCCAIGILLMNKIRRILNNIQRNN